MKIDNGTDGSRDIDGEARGVEDRERESINFFAERSEQCSQVRLSSAATWKGIK